MSENYGHITLIDGSHVALAKEQAEALWEMAEQSRKRRAEALPTVEDTLRAFIQAEERMRELGWWRGGGLRVKKGDDCAVVEPGSTGIFKGWFDTDGQYVHYCDCVSSPRKTFLKPLADLTDEERRHMDECMRREESAYSAMIERAMPDHRS